MPKKIPKSPFGPTHEDRNIDKLSPKYGRLGPPRIPIQGNLFHVEKQVERDGIEMGVLRAD